jgi:hypothetical protein
MGLITVKTAARIWNCYREIDGGTKLLSEMKERMERGEDPNPRDGFGRHRCLQLGIPSGDNSRTLLDVEPRLALSIINAHIAEKRRELVEANEQARIELESPEDTF